MIRAQETIYTVVAADPKAGEFGVGVASSGLAVGKNVPFTGAFVGAIAIQGYTSPFFGISGMKLLREGVPAKEVIERAMTGDPLKEHRQMLVIDAAGKTAVFTGSGTAGYSGSREGENYAVAGCGLSGEEVVEASAKAFEESDGDLAGRLGAALKKAAEKSDGGTFESAAIRISHDKAYPILDLRIDKRNDAVDELLRLLETWRKRNANASA